MSELGREAESAAGLAKMPPTEAVRREMDKVLASRAFRTAKGQKNFLRYAVEQTIAGHGNEIKEYSVGVEVFHRGESFDPRLDPIVRIEARNLRLRLAKYYLGEGEHDDLRIEFSKGSYAPSFRAIIPSDHIEEPTDRAPAGFSSPPQTIPQLVAAKVRGFLEGRAWILAALLLVVSVFAAYLLSHGQGRSSVSKESPSIVVLPFLNRSDDLGKDTEVFSDGLTDELIDLLGRVPGLHVVARTSAFQFKGQALDIRKIGRALNVGTVLEGSVRRYGNRLRITVQLNDATNGYHVWSKSYDRELKDALAVQREIALAITGALGLELVGKNGRPWLAAAADAAMPVNPEAYQDYLRGRYFIKKETAESMRTAIGYFRQAIAKDPKYAPAYAGLARCYSGIPPLTDTRPLDVVPQIRAAALKAIELDDTIGEAHVTLGYADMYSFQWAAAREELQKAVELGPGDANAHWAYGSYLSQTGSLEQSLAENKIALDRDPVSPDMAQAVANSLYYLGRYDEAIAQYQRALALDPNFGMARRGLGNAYLQSRRYAEAVAELQAAHRLLGGDPFTSALLGYAYAVSGDTTRARATLSQFEERSKREPAFALEMAQIYIGLGQRDRAFQWLSKAVDEHQVYLFLNADPLYRPLRPDPRFAGLLKLMRF
jgi:TolB-like protein/tetratricopeptide (TPR) repeat protein